MLKTTDREIIRHLAAEVAEIAALPVREEQFGFAWNDHQLVITFGAQTIAQMSADEGYQNLRHLVLRPGKPGVISYQQIAPTCFGRVLTPPQVTATPECVRLKLCAESAQGALLDLPVDQGEQDSPIASIGGTSS